MVITRQYDFWADFPLYPLNVIADLNAFLGAIYVHGYPFDVSLAPDPSTSYQGTYGDTSYYFFETEDLPLFGPLRTLGVPESLIDVVEPFFRVIVELGYDRSIPPWEPTPARLIPTLNPETVAADLVNAIGEGINNALAITGSPPPLSISAAQATETAEGDVSVQATSREQATEGDQTMSGQQVTDTGQTTSGQQTTDTGQTTSREQATDTGQTTSREQATDTDQTTSREQATDTDQTTSTTDSTSQPAQRADTPATHRPLVRGPLGVFGQRSRDLRHHGDGDQPTTQTAAAGDRATTAGTSSPASSSARSSSTGTSSGGGSAGSGADGS